MRRVAPMLTLAAAALWPAPAPAQQRSQLGPLCTTDTTPADQQIDACSKIIALKVFTGEKLATIHFWRAVGWNKKGNETQMIADASEAIRLKPSVPSCNLRGSAYCDKGEYDIAIADFNAALRMGARAISASSITTAATPCARRAAMNRRSPTTASRTGSGRRAHSPAVVELVAARRGLPCGKTVASGSQRRPAFKPFDLQEASHPLGDRMC